MLPTANTLANDLLALTPSDNAITAITAFVGILANFINLVQAGPTGTPGILTFGNAAMITALLSMQPVDDNSWLNNFGNAFEAGLNSSVITPGTVTLPVWVGSSVDVATSSSPTATILTIAASRALLISGLTTCQPTDSAPIEFATAFRNAALALEFNCIGLGSPPTFTPIPVTLNAE